MNRRARPRRKAAPSNLITQDARAFLDLQVNETGRGGLQEAIILYALALGYRVHHCYDSRLCGPDEGMPDLILVGHGRIIFIELKKQTKKLRTAQEVWAYELQRSPAEYYYWRPSDWSNGTVERTLAPAA